MAGDAPAVLENLWTVRVLLRRDVARLLEQWQIDVGLDVALGAGITIPVPGSPDVSAFFDDPDVLDAGIFEMRP